MPTKKQAHKPFTHLPPRRTLHCQKRNLIIIKEDFYGLSDIPTFVFNQETENSF